MSANNMLEKSYIINPQRMRKGYGSHSVCVYLSVTTLAAPYLAYTLKVIKVS